jgi:DNA modification methylase
MQLQFFSNLELPVTIDSPSLVSFREIVSEITDTAYLTHSIYYYPAKFIPQVVRFCIHTYTKADDWILDPFAGSATVGLEAYLCKRNSVLMDLNPLLKEIVPIKIYRGSSVPSRETLYQILSSFNPASAPKFYPQWSNIRYWYPDEIFEALASYWGWLKGLESSVYSQLIQAALIKASKYFSYAEHKTPKLFRSKTKIKLVDDLVKQDWQQALQSMIYDGSRKNLESVSALVRRTRGFNVKTFYFAGVDSSTFLPPLEQSIDCIITSPPYLQAQEYIRTFKLDLYWLGYTETDVKAISALEIPYRKATRIIETPTINQVKSQLSRKDLLQYLDSYFCHTINALENTSRLLRRNGHLCVFIGSPKADGVEIPIWKVLKEYFSEKGFETVSIFEDRIQTRQLFRSRKNKNPDGMKSEFLIVLKKTS